MDSCVNRASAVSAAASRSFARAICWRNHLVDAVLDFLGGDADGVHDGAFAGRAVGFDDDAVEAEQDGAAVNLRVQALLEVAEGAAGEQRAEAGGAGSRSAPS